MTDALTLHADLDPESAWSAAQAGIPRGWARPDPARLAETGLLMAALAEPGDRLILPVRPEAVTPGELLAARGAHVLAARLAPAPAGGVIAWAETGRWPSAARVEATPELAAIGDEGLVARLRRILPALRGSSAVAARVNRRDLAVEVARGLGEDEAHLAADVDAALARIALLGADGGPWVAKALFAAGGRNRLLGRGPGPGADGRRRLERLAALGGGLVVEPWRERLADFGIAGLVDGTRAAVLGIHRLRVGASGAVTAIELDARARADGLRDHEEDALRGAFAAAARAVSGPGHRGLLVVDAFRWRAADGGERFRSLVEINARMTLGVLARCWAERAAAAGRPGHDVLAVGAPGYGAAAEIPIFRGRLVGAALARGGGS